MHAADALVLIQAFVGYRDYGDTQQLEVKDFVEKEGFGGLQSFLDSIVAKGGDDSTEDIAGGLKVTVHSAHRSAALSCSLPSVHSMAILRTST